MQVVSASKAQPLYHGLCIQPPDGNSRGILPSDPAITTHNLAQNN